MDSDGEEPQQKKILTFERKTGSDQLFFFYD